jgi:BirA family biotin operon repressor/biotin-[acetyl-CoA-carboxylase] ligase
LNIPLLERLRNASGEFISLGELGRDRRRVREDLAALERFGFQIECHPYLGAAYRGPAHRLCPDQIEHGLQTRRIGRRIAVWSRVSSTNDLAARAASTTANDGLVVLAEEQTAGRGQRGRTWTAPPRSSILMSVLVFPPGRPAPSGLNVPDGCAWPTAMAAVATAEVVESWSGRVAHIKWPNDVRVQRRKIAGILVERVLSRLPQHGLTGRSKPEFRPVGVVIGIGLNSDVDLASLPQELRPRVTSLVRLGGGPIDRSELARDLIHRLDFWYEQVVTGGPAVLNASWRARSEHLGKEVLVTTPTKSVHGRLVDLDLSDGLTVELAAECTQGHAEFPRSPIACDPSSRRVKLEGVLTLEECGVAGLSSLPGRYDHREPAGAGLEGDSRGDCLGSGSKGVIDFE